MLEAVSAAGQSVAIASMLAGARNTAPIVSDQYIEVFGTHPGGVITNVVATDIDSDGLTFAIVGLSGAYADQGWTINRQTGTLDSHFTRNDAPGSEFTSIEVRVSDGLDAALVMVNVRWAAQFELQPEFIVPIVPDLDTESAMSPLVVLA